MKSVRALISGRVQGVWYRAWTAGEADKLGLTGWVRNCADGTVEALFCGPAEKVDVMLARCRKGPPLARVDAVAIEPAEAPDRAGFHKLSGL
ncbi:MAG: acylphosphatase [Rhodospirillales bacterium]|nr:acylphosphatase [Rhodospirillales bacterium]